MSLDELHQYKKVQSIAKETIELLKSFIREGLTERQIKESAENFLRKKGVNSFWYYDIGAFVLVGKRTTASISGREYRATDEKVKTDDLVTIDLSPEMDDFWGDLARSFIFEKGRVVEPAHSHLPEIAEGIKIEERLHKKFQETINENMSLGEAFTQMNSLIDEFGFENLDFKKNLGHSN